MTMKMDLYPIGNEVLADFTFSLKYYFDFSFDRGGG